MLGNGRLEAYCFDGSNRLCHIRGKLRKKVCYMTELCLSIIERERGECVSNM
jgi:initiation factor 1A